MTSQALSPSVLRGVCDVLAETDEGLSNRQINELLTEAGIEDPTTAAPPGTYIRISKRDRLFNALAARQERDKSANALLRCIEIAMAPVSYAGRAALFSSRQAELNERLLHAGLQLDDGGKIHAAAPATSVSDARRRTKRLRRLLEDRGVHPKVMAACPQEISDENFFHLVFEATKGLAAEIRRLSGLEADGAILVNEAFEFEKDRLPVLAWNRLESATDRSEHRGLTQLCRGVVGAFRNPAAHEQKIAWEMPEQEALDICALLSLLHRRLEAATAVPATLRCD